MKVEKQTTRDPRRDVFSGLNKLLRKFIREFFPLQMQLLPDKIHVCVNVLCCDHVWAKIANQESIKRRAKNYANELNRSKNTDRWDAKKFTYSFWCLARASQYMKNNSSRFVRKKKIKSITTIFTERREIRACLWRIRRPSASTSVKAISSVFVMPWAWISCFFTPIFSFPIRTRYRIYPRSDY